MSEQSDLLAKLHRDTRVPPPDKVSQVDKGFGPIDVLGHADTTDLLLQHDPCWNWSPLSFDEDGLPAVLRDQNGWPRGMWIRLTVHGHTRLGFGTCPPNKADAIKELIGDAIRNAAMRFGVALSLWSKIDWVDLVEEEDPAESPPAELPSARDAATPPGDKPVGIKPKGRQRRPVADTDDLAQGLAQSLREKLMERLLHLSEDAEVQSQRRREVRKAFIQHYERAMDEDLKIGDLSIEEMHWVFSELDRREW
jgi:hypothetical protein